MTEEIIYIYFFLSFSLHIRLRTSLRWVTGTPTTTCDNVIVRTLAKFMFRSKEASSRVLTDTHCYACIYLVLFYLINKRKISVQICSYLLKFCHIGKISISSCVFVRNPGRDMRVLFFNLFRRLNMLFERLVRSCLHNLSSCSNDIIKLL